MPLTVEPVRTGKDVHAFVVYPWSLYRDDPHWIPPLIGDVKALLDPGKNPFFEHGEMQAYLARRDGRIVGRIAAVRNRAHEEFQQEAVGFFGFYESENEPAVASALLDAARGWLRERGLPVMRGPANPTSNDEYGMLVQGFDTPPMVMMPHARPYYDALMTGAGLEKEKDLLAYIYEDSARAVPERLERGAALAEKRNPGVVVRPLEKKHFDRDVGAFRTVYNQAWERNWGFVPMTAHEIDHMAKQLKPVVDPGLVLIAEKNGQPVGFALGLPDLNQAMKKANGRLFPLGLVKVLLAARNLDRARILVLGVIKEYRKTGIDVLLYRDLFRYGLKKGYRVGEFSWILEDNMAIRTPLENFGARVYKVYRVYHGPTGK